eukprot:gnl/Dysnectes_brevis/2075_a2401_1152.p1 GENE.gnl/Dysnectes_brevis/2075_a2401_1152~~gnl/Dysnectes_brevis/2075_a2401_1152.p1  ORF type:complete len:269 (+),score=75.05 gnl/Dysnectes_brevis/2075_a2401_1152:60-866(+)
MYITIIALLFVLHIGSIFAKESLVWMCLERCSEDIPTDFASIAAHAGVGVNAVSFEAYNLEYNSELRWNNYTSINDQLKTLPVTRFPMVTTTNIDKLRQVIANPDPFIDAMVSEGLTHGYTGYNIDFEVYDCTQEDSVAYVAFLNAVTDALHAVGMQLQVDIAGWTTLWDEFYTDTPVAYCYADTLIDMSTYSGVSSFDAYFQREVDYIPLDQLSVGLENTDPNTGEVYADIEKRFSDIREEGVTKVAIWMMPIPDEMWGYLEDFLAE